MDVSSVKHSPVANVIRLSQAEAARSDAADTVLQKAERPVEAAELPPKMGGAEEDPARDKLENAMSSIQEFVQSVRRNLDFQLDDSSGKVVVKVTDSESGDVIRQIPSEEALKLAESLDEVRSLLFKAEA
ncbi:MAG: flagellar protein FlaG [Burkholderiaceae bacterium]|nr:MAG: flagellar protein FlaG [Burkholderiaceae bacterium]